MSKDGRDLPLSRYRVLDLADGTGCFCGRIFGDLGADVIKVEPPCGDAARNIGPFYHDIAGKNGSLFFFACNTNKRSITLNMEAADGRDIFRSLTKSADFVIESFSPGYMDRLGLGYPELKKINRRIIMVSITPFGQDGPRCDWKASDIVSIGMGGLSYITGSPDRPPARVSVDQAHFMASIQGAMGAMIAHYYRQATGDGQHVDVSTQESVAISALLVPELWDLQKFIMPREGAFLSRSGKKVRHLWPCKDGYVSWRIFGGGLGVKTRAFVEWMNSEGEAGELMEVDWQQMDYLTVPHDQFYRWQELFGAFFKKHTKAELCKEALARGIVLIAASTPKDLLEDAQLRARDYWVEIEHPELNAILTYPGALYKSSEIQWQFHRAPQLGEHNSEVYKKELGFSRDSLAAMKQHGII